MNINAAKQFNDQMMHKKFQADEALPSQISLIIFRFTVLHISRNVSSQNLHIFNAKDFSGLKCMECAKESFAIQVQHPQLVNTQLDPE